MELLHMTRQLPNPTNSLCTAVNVSASRGLRTLDPLQTHTSLSPCYKILTALLGVIQIKLKQLVWQNVHMIINPPTKRISVTAEQQTFLRVLPTRWRRKPDMEQSNVIVALCIRYAQWPAKAESKANTRCDPPGSSTERYRTFNNRLLSSSGENNGISAATL